MKEMILPQIVAVGIYNAQVALKNRTVSRNRKTTMFEIEIPMEDGGISYIDDASHPIKKNLVICAKPGQIRHTRVPFKCYYIHMILQEGFLYDMAINMPDFIETSDSKRIRNIFMQMCEHYDNGTKEDECMLHSLFLELIYLLYRHSRNSKTSYRAKRSNRSVIENAIAYINENITSKLDLDALASEAKFSPTYFHKLFKAATGKTLHDYIEEERIKKSVNLLISTDMTLTQIAYECGFSSQSYFSYAFKRRMGLPPCTYAKKAMERYAEPSEL